MASQKHCYGDSTSSEENQHRIRTLHRNMLAIDLLPSEPLALCSLSRLPEWENNSEIHRHIDQNMKESDLPQTPSHSACRLSIGWQRQITWHCSLITLLALPAAFSFSFVWLFLNFKKVRSGGYSPLIWNLCKSCLYKPQRAAEPWGGSTAADQVHTLVWLSPFGWAAFRESMEPEPPVAAALIHILEYNNEEDGTSIFAP